MDGHTKEDGSPTSRVQHLMHLHMLKVRFLFFPSYISCASNARFGIMNSIFMFLRLLNIFHAEFHVWNSKIVPKSSMKCQTWSKKRQILNLCCLLSRLNCQTWSLCCQNYWVMNWILVWSVEFDDEVPNFNSLLPDYLYEVWSLSLGCRTRWICCVKVVRTKLLMLEWGVMKLKKFTSINSNMNYNTFDILLLLPNLVPCLPTRTLTFQVPCPHKLRYSMM